MYLFITMPWRRSALWTLNGFWLCPKKWDCAGNMERYVSSPYSVSVLNHRCFDMTHLATLYYTTVNGGTMFMSWWDTLWGLRLEGYLPGIICPQTTVSSRSPCWLDCILPRHMLRHQVINARIHHLPVGSGPLCVPGWTQSLDTQ
jgi:hypothetical protein